MVSWISIYRCTSGAFSAVPRFPDDEPEQLRSQLEHFDPKPFLKHQAQRLEKCSLLKPYQVGEDTFVYTVKIMARINASGGANVINSYVLYQVKRNYNGLLNLKARIAPHANDDDLKTLLASSCSTCPSTGLRIAEFIAALHGWLMYKDAVKAAFL